MAVALRLLCRFRRVHMAQRGSASKFGPSGLPVGIHPPFRRVQFNRITHHGWKRAQPEFRRGFRAFWPENDGQSLPPWAALPEISTFGWPYSREGYS